MDYVIPHLGTALYQASLSKHLVCIKLLLDAGTLSAWPSAYLSVCLDAHLSVCLSAFCVLLSA